LIHYLKVTASVHVYVLVVNTTNYIEKGKRQPEDGTKPSHREQTLQEHYGRDLLSGDLSEDRSVDDGLNDCFSCCFCSTSNALAAALR
jgi:hypothetical protein